VSSCRTATVIADAQSVGVAWFPEKAQLLEQLRYLPQLGFVKPSREQGVQDLDAHMVGRCERQGLLAMPGQELGGGVHACLAAAMNHLTATLESTTRSLSAPATPGSVTGARPDPYRP